VITLGLDMVEYHPRLWNPSGDKTIIHADFLPAEIDAHYHPEVELVGDLAHSLWMLNTRVEALSSPPRYQLNRQREIRADMSADLAQYGEDGATGTVKPQKVLWDLRRALGRNDILISDVGAHKMWIARHFHCHEPNTCLIPNGFCSMGFALPGAIAANLVFPDRNIVAIAGDGGFLMNVQEMETARRLNSDITVVVWEDKEYGLIAWKQQDQFDRHTELSFGNPDWDVLADAFGWSCHRVADSAGCRETLEAAIREPGPSLVIVPIDYRENALLTKKLGEITCAI
jgi:acetolactate synthase I/II/III large subunit